MISGLIDVHSHLLPGLDDGCASLEESLECARRMVRAGYVKSFCTPHIWPNYPNNNVREIPQRVRELQTQLDLAKIPLTLIPGGELNLRPELIDTPADEVPTYGMLGKYALADIWVDELPAYFETTIRKLQSHGLTVILAHPERMRAVQLKPELAEEFKEMGLLLQGNLACFNDRPGAATRRVAEQFLAEGRYFMLGSDLHRPDSLAERLGGLARATELAGNVVIGRLMIENPQRLIDSRDPE